MRILQRDRTQSEPSTSLEGELFRFIDTMVHDLARDVVLIRTLAALLEDQRYALPKEVKEKVSQISEAASDLGHGLNLMGSLGSDRRPMTCAFVADVLQPAVVLAERFRLRVRLIIEPTARAAPTVVVRPGLALWALTRLLVAAHPTHVRCSAQMLDGSVMFVLGLPGSVGMIYEDELHPLVRLLEMAGVSCKPHDRITGFTLEMKETLDR